MLPRELQAYIVFGQQHFGNLAEHGGLVARQPAQLGRSKARHHHAAGQLRQAGQLGRHLRALNVGTCVIPQNGGAQDLILRVQQHGTVHLPRQADGLNGTIRLRVRLAKGCQCKLSSSPPFGRVLLAVTRVWAADGQRRACGVNLLVRCIQQQRLDFGCANVNAEEHGGVVFVA